MLRRLLLLLTALAAVAGLLATAPGSAAAPAPACAPGGAPVVLTGSVGPQDAKTYRTLPFEVAPGTTRVEVGYEWADVLPNPGVPVVGGVLETVLDLGLWDEGGVGTPAGFRGWSGSRQGRTGAGQDPVWVQADSAERGYRPDPVQPGTWHVDLGIAYVAPTGATYEVTVRCLAAPMGPPFQSRPVDADHVARGEPGWYLGDLHLHAYHSHPRGLAGPEMVAAARAAGLDFVPVTEYVTDQHHRELGPVQEANPDLVIWPGREVITYYGHVIVLGETPHVVDWRHGAPGVSLRGIEDATVADGALFGVAHPTIFPTPLLASFCRGCELSVGETLDWDEVTTLEVVTGPSLVDDTQLGGPGLGVQVQNPFTLTAIDLWHQQLRKGHKITAVSGSDDKLGPGYGTSVTAVYAEQLSRRALAEALRAGHAYVRARGAEASPEVEVRVTTPDGQEGIVGDTVHADVATLSVHVTGAAGQTLVVTRDGLPAGLLPIATGDERLTVAATRDPGSGPLGTFWRVDTVDAQGFTTIGNPVFLADPAARPATTSTTGPTSEPPTTTPTGGRLPSTGGAVPVLPVLGLVALAVATLGALAGDRRRLHRH